MSVASVVAYRGGVTVDTERAVGHAFDDHFGEWATRLRVLKRPLSEDSTWVEYLGTSTVRPLLGGRANVVELVAEGSAGRIEAASVRLFEPGTGRWTLNFFNVVDGVMAPPVSGGFDDGVGVFLGEEIHKGRPVGVRFIITWTDVNTLHFEQAFSADGGANWEVNWIAVDERRR